jgi:hypothetical protein
MSAFAVLAKGVDRNVTLSPLRFGKRKARVSFFGLHDFSGTHLNELRPTHLMNAILCIVLPSLAADFNFLAVFRFH